MDTLAQPKSKTIPITEVCEDLSICEKTFYNMARRGHIPAIRIGRAYRVPRDRYEEWKANGGTQSAA